MLSVYVIFNDIASKTDSKQVFKQMQLILGGHEAQWCISIGFGQWSLPLEWNTLVGPVGRVSGSW
jgi:hypothetical protein